MTAQAQAIPLRGRALVVGSLGALIIGFGAPYATFVLKGSYVDLDFSTPAAIFLIFVLMAGVQPVLRHWMPRWALSSAEGVIVYSMMIVACALTTMGMTCQLLPIIAAPYYYPTSGRVWAEQYGDSLHPWLSLPDKFAANRFFEGLRTGETIPWTAWIRPLAVWTILLLALYWTSVCLMVILRRQWSGRERLAYPLTQLPLELVRGNEGGGRPLLKQPWMWAGFVPPFVIGSIIGLHHYFPSSPDISLVWSFPMFRDTQSLTLRLSFPMIGFFYQVNTEVLFSLWFFNLLAWMVRGYMSLIGVQWNENLGIYGSTHPAFKYLGMGAMAALILTGFRAALPHLVESWRAGVRGQDDGQEPLSYRVAWRGLLVGTGVLFLWLWASGIAPVPLAFFLIAAFVLLVGLTRVVVEAGLAEVVPSTIASGFTVAALGVPMVGTSSLPGLGMTYVWNGDMRTSVMASAAHSFKLAEIVPRHRRHVLIRALFLAILLAASASIYLTLRLAYERGGINLNSWFFGDGAQAPWKWVGDKRANPTPPSSQGWTLTLAGAAFTVFLAAMRQRYVWWPFHPIGFTVGSIWIMDELWLSALIAWVCKVLTIRYGGLAFFQRVRLFFLGLILGQFTCNGMWLILDALCGQHGNQIFWI
jgi:hypothetical protein